MGLTIELLEKPKVEKKPVKSELTNLAEFAQAVNGAKLAIKSLSPVVEAEPESTTELQPDMQGVAKELVDLQKLYNERDMDYVIKTIASKKKVLQEFANQNYKPEDSVAWVVENGMVSFSVRANSTKVTKPLDLLEKIQTQFGDEALLSCITIKITDLKKYLSEKELEAFTEKESGSRTCKVTPTK